MTANLWTALGALFAFLAVAMGAFGAHALSTVLDERSLAIFHTAAQYQMYHALALIGLGLWSFQHPDVSVQLPAWAFSLGILFFSGSLYALAFTGIKILGAITPIGGVGFLVGWLTFAWTAWRFGKGGV